MIASDSRAEKTVDVPSSASPVGFSCSSSATAHSSCAAVAAMCGVSDATMLAAMEALLLGALVSHRRVPRSLLSVQMVRARPNQPSQAAQERAQHHRTHNKRDEESGGWTLAAAVRRRPSAADGAAGRLGAPAAAAAVAEEKPGSRGGGHQCALAQAVVGRSSDFTGRRSVHLALSRGTQATRQPPRRELGPAPRPGGRKHPKIARQPTTPHISPTTRRSNRLDLR